MLEIITTHNDSINKVLLLGFKVESLDFRSFFAESMQNVLQRIVLSRKFWFEIYNCAVRNVVWLVDFFVNHFSKLQRHQEELLWNVGF